MPKTLVHNKTIAYLIALASAVTFGVIGVLVDRITGQSKYAHETCSSALVYCQRDRQAFYDGMLSPPQPQEKMRTPQPDGGVTIHY